MEDSRNIVVVWDLDDTLYQQSDQFIRATERLLETQLEDGIALYKRFKHFSDITYDACELGEYEIDEMRVRRIRMTLEELGTPIDVPAAVQWQQLYLEEQQQAKLHPTMVQILEQLKSEQVPLGIITNGASDHQRMKISTLGLDKWFSEKNTIVSGDYDISKPDPQLFGKLAKQYPPSKAFIYIGDNYQNDICGSQNVGWQTIWFNYHGLQNDPIENAADFTAGNYEELLNILEQQVLS